MTGLRLLREQRLMTQADLAKASGVGIATINRIENGKVTPSFKTTRSIAQALNVDPILFRNALISKQGVLFIP